MELQEAIRGRRSIRHFLPKPVSKKIIEEIIADTLWAPSWGNTQPWEIVAVTGEPLQGSGAQVVIVAAVLHHHEDEGVDAHLAATGTVVTAAGSEDLGSSRGANDGGQGWSAPPVADWLHESMQTASMAFFGKPSMYMGTGGTIPFMSMLGEKFPDAQFLITGLLGPKSNAHGPNEFLHIETGKRLTACVAQVLLDHFEHKSGLRKAA